MLLDRTDQRTEQIAGCTNPAGQSGAGYLDALTRDDLRLPVKRQVIPILRNDDASQQTRSRQAPCDGSGWRKSFDHAVTSGAGVLRPHMPDDYIGLRNQLQLFGDVFAELP